MYFWISHGKITREILEEDCKNNHRMEFWRNSGCIFVEELHEGPLIEFNELLICFVELSWKKIRGESGSEWFSGIIPKRYFLNPRFIFMVFLFVGICSRYPRVTTRRIRVTTEKLSEGNSCENVYKISETSETSETLLMKYCFKHETACSCNYHR